MATIWEILDLEGPTTDEKVIKKAYAARLRIVRPDEDQTGFMALRDAFERARTYARIHAEEIDTDRIFEASRPQEAAPPQSTENTEGASKFEYSEDYVPEEQVPVFFDDAADFNFVEMEGLSPEEEAEQDFHDQMREKIAAIIRSPWTINSEHAWDELFAIPELEFIDVETRFQRILRTSLLAMAGFFGQEDGDKVLKMKPAIAAHIFHRMDWMDPSGLSDMERHELYWLSDKLGLTLYDQPSEAELDFYEAQEEEEDGGVSWKIALVTVLGTSLLIYISNNFF